MCIAVPMKVVELIPPESAVVDMDGISMEISLSLVGNVNIGDYVIVHTGFALEILDTDEAENTLSLFNEIFTTDQTSS